MNVLKTLPTLCLFCKLCVWSTSSTAASLTFNTALPISKDEWILREQLIWMQSSNDPTSMQRTMKVSGLMSMLGYGVSRDFTVFGVLPYLDKRLNMNIDGATVRRQNKGVGDASIMARYTIFEDNLPGHTFRIAPFVNLKAPTGEHQASDRRGRLAPALQVGSGSWDGQVGVVTSWQSLDWGGDMQLAHQINRSANGYRAGTATRFDLSIQRRLLPDTLGEGVPSFLYGGIEFNLTHTGKNQNLGIDDPDSGGTTLSLTPTLQYVTRNWVLEAGIQIPVSQRLNGTALKNDITLTTGFRLNF